MRPYLDYIVAVGGVGVANIGALVIEAALVVRAAVVVILNVVSS